MPDSGVSFHLLEQKTVPKATVSEQGGIVFGQITVAAEAIEPGKDGNLDTGRLTITTLPFSRQDKIYADITGKFSGGDATIKRVVSEEDFSQAEAEIYKELEELLTSNIEMEISPDEFLIPALINLMDINSTATPSVAQESDKFTLRSTLTIQALVFNLDDLKKVVVPEASKILFENKQVVPITQNNFSFVVASSSDGLSRAVTKTHLEASVVNNFNIFEIKNSVKGLNEASARREILKIEGVRDVRFKSSWNLTGKIPRRLDNITLIVKP
jgi:hypothetical protein